MSRVSAAAPSVGCVGGRSRARASLERPRSGENGRTVPHARARSQPIVGQLDRAHCHLPALSGNGDSIVNVMPGKAALPEPIVETAVECWRTTATAHRTSKGEGHGKGPLVSELRHVHTSADLNELAAVQHLRPQEEGRVVGSRNCDARTAFIGSTAAAGAVR